MDYNLYNNVKGADGLIERPVELWVNDEKITTFMCTPLDLEDLAIGHMLTRGMVKDVFAIEDIDVRALTNQVFVTARTAIVREHYTVPEIIVSGTSSVAEFSENIYKIPKVESNFAIELKELIKYAQFMIDEAVIYKKTGGVHSALIVAKDRYFLREDIGRHCAVDKAVGSACKKGVDFSNSVILTTGRISLDMLLKSASMRIPVVASLKYPSDMGIKLAKHYDIAIVARIMEKPLIYANKERIVV